MSQDLIKALESIAGLPMPAQDNMVSANMRKIVEDALSRHRSSVESVELPEADGTCEIDCGQAPGGGREVMYVDGYTASTVRSLIAAAVEREREAIIQMMPGGHSVDPQMVCDAIRARGEK